MSEEEKHVRDTLICQIEGQLVDRRPRLARQILEDGIRCPTSSSLKKSLVEKSINRFIRHGMVEHAHGLFQMELASGLSPSTSTASHLLQAGSMAPLSYSAILETITGALIRRRLEWDEGLLGVFLSATARSGHWNTLSNVVAHYRKIAQPGWNPSAIHCAIIIRALCGGGSFADALTWLRHYREYDYPNIGQRPSSAPYEAFIDGYASNSKSQSNPGPCYIALSQMIQDNKLSRVHPFNAILALEVRRMDFRRVFALYRIIKRHHEIIQPNAATFCTMFKAHDKWHPGLAPRVPRPTARNLFQQMTLLHNYETKGAVHLGSQYLTAEVLNVALSHFVHIRDYAAAMVVLRTFGVCRRVPTAQTELAVLSPILRRMQREITTMRGSKSYRWVDAMRGSIVDPREKLDELKDIRSKLLRMRQRSHLTALVLPATRLSRSKRQDPFLRARMISARWKRLSIPHPNYSSVTQINLARTRSLVRRAFDADRQQYSQSSINDLYKRDMIIACEEMLPPVSHC